MLRRMSVLASAAMLAATVGCSQTQPGSSISLGLVDKDLAFTTAKDVIAQYYPIQSADPEAGTIQCQPAAAKDRQERLLGASPTRDVATCQIYKAEDGQVMATVAVAVQQLGSSGFRAAGNQGSYSGVPNETPAQMEAATTPEQNQTWKTLDYSASTQRKILDDIYRRLHPDIAPQPSSAPAPTATTAPAD
jgi:hypothetical protein